MTILYQTFALRILYLIFTHRTPEPVIIHIGSDPYERKA